MDDPLVIAGREFGSRLLLGSLIAAAVSRKPITTFTELRR